MAVGQLPLPGAAWPPRVILIESPGLPTGSVQGAGRDHGLDLRWVSDPFSALLLLGRDGATGLVVPTDLETADVAQLTASVVSWGDVPVLVAMSPEESAAAVAGRAVETGCSGLLPVPFGEDQLATALSRAARNEWGWPAEVIVVGGVTIDAGGLTVTGPDGVRVQLSSMQFACLHLLAVARPSVVRLEALADHLGLAGEHGPERTRRLVARLRHQMAAVAGGVDLVENVRGVGYRLRG